MTALLSTKLHQPVLQQKHVQRPQLIQKLSAGLDMGHLLFLVSAPAGFGKTNCVSEWINTLDGWPVTWLSLDVSDDDPGRFFSYFIAALQKVDADLGQEIEGVLRSGQLPPGEIISTTLINDTLELEGKFLLVLDDFHIIQDRFIISVLENLVTNLPSTFHLVLVTREDPSLPLAQLRANNKLTEIRAKDLCFSTSDIERFLTDMLDLSLSDADINILEEKTEGWIVGLQLAGLSIRDRNDPSGFITALSGSHRHILSYLTEEVLHRQPKEIQQFLLQTSILDKLNGDLCNAVTGRSDSSVLLEGLFNANLFLVPLDDEGQWYRYHHLFADLLRTRQEENTTELHQRASQWYARADMASEAIQHALFAEDYALAVDLLETHAMEMIMQGYTKTVNDWVEMIPEEWRPQSPRTNLAFAWMYLLRGAYAQANPYLERLQESFGDSQSESKTWEESPSLMAEWLALQSLMLYRRGRWAESKNIAARALEITPEQDSRVRSLAYYALASVSWQLEDYSNTVKSYQIATQHSRAGNNLLVEMLSTAALAGMLLEHGQLHKAFEIASQAVERIELSDVLHPGSAVVYAALGDAYYHWHQVEDARYYLQRALHLSTLGGAITVSIFCHALLARQFQIEGDLEAAFNEIQTAIDMLPVEAPENTQQEVVVQQVSIYLACNRLAAAEMALQRYGFSFGTQFSYPDLPPGKSVPYVLGRLHNSGLRALLYHAQVDNNSTDLKAGIELTNHLIPRAFEGQQLFVALEALLLRAQMHAMLGDLQASQADYVQALELAEPEGFISIFIEHGQSVVDAFRELVKRNQLGNVKTDYVKRILEAFSTAHPEDRDGSALVSSTGTVPMALIDPLTERELDVLRLMTEGLKYKEIAERLFISQNTVRFHVKAIYGKFNVNNRTQAIERARQLQIL